VSDAVGSAIVTAKDYKATRNQRCAMKLGASAIRTRVIYPASFAGGLVHPVDEAVAGRNNDGFPHDRRGREDSAARVVAPDNVCGLQVGASLWVLHRRSRLNTYQQQG
jgi:hypothetical protein